MSNTELEPEVQQVIAELTKRIYRLEKIVEGLVDDQ